MRIKVLAVLLSIILSHPSHATIKETSYSKLKNSGYCKVDGVFKDNSYLKSLGELSSIVLSVDFKNNRSFLTTSENAKEYTDTFTDFVYQASYQKLKIKVDIMESWINMPETSSFYANSFQGYTQSVLNIADPKVNFSNYDIVYILVHDNVKDFFEYGPVVSYRDSSMYKTEDGIVKNIVVGTDPEISMGGSKWRWMAHETMHLIGLEHPHNHENDDNTKASIFSIMDFGWVAPGLYALERWKLNWISDRQVRCIDSSNPSTTYHKVNSIEGFDRLGKMVAIKISDSEILVIESRRSEFMDDMPKNYEGLLVYSYNNEYITPVLSRNFIIDYSKPDYNGDRVVGTIKSGESLSYKNIVISSLSFKPSSDFVKIEIK